MWTKTPPFPGLSDYQLVMHVVIEGRRPGRPTPIELHGEALPDQFWTLIEKCWTKDALMRPSMSEVVAYFQPTQVRSSPQDIPESRLLDSNGDTSLPLDQVRKDGHLVC
jgi:hypothetical protein